MGNNHVKAWALVVLGFGYFAVFGSVVGIIATFVADYDTELADLTWQLTVAEETTGTAVAYLH